MNRETPGNPDLASEREQTRFCRYCQQHRPRSRIVAAVWIDRGMGSRKQRQYICDRHTDLPTIQALKSQAPKKATP